MKYWITDLGEPLLVIGHGGKSSLERYGVWAFKQNAGKHEVVEVSDDLAYLTEKYDVDPNDVIDIRKPDANSQKS